MSDLDIYTDGVGTVFAKEIQNPKSKIQNHAATRRLKLVMEYDGTDFSGFQFQPSYRTVQGDIESAFWNILVGSSDKTRNQQPASSNQQSEIGNQKSVISRLAAAGRTDAGVHALAQFAHIDVATRMTNKTILKALNGHLPPDVRILSVEDAPPDFHARFSAKSRTYRYRLLRRESPLLRRYTWTPKFRWDDALIREAVNLLPGLHSFKSFSRQRPGQEKYLCTILSTSWEPDPDGATFNITADRFLHAMVRGIVGALTDLGRGYYTPDDFRRLLDHPDKVGAVHTAPAKGLMLVGVTY